MTGSRPERGEVWLAALDPVRAGEQGGTRPVLVMSADAFNSWPVGLVVVVPLTTRRRGFGHHIEVRDGGLTETSFAMPEYVRSITGARLDRRLGSAASDSVEDVGAWLRRILGL